MNDPKGPYPTDHFVLLLGIHFVYKLVFIQMLFSSDLESLFLSWMGQAIYVIIFRFSFVDFPDDFFFLMIG